MPYWQYCEHAWRGDTRSHEASHTAQAPGGGDIACSWWPVRILVAASVHFWRNAPHGVTRQHVFCMSIPVCAGTSCGKTRGGGLAAAAAYVNKRLGQVTAREGLVGQAECNARKKLLSRAFLILSAEEKQPYIDKAEASRARRRVQRQEALSQKHKAQKRIEGECKSNGARHIDCECVCCSRGCGEGRAIGARHSC